MTDPTSDKWLGVEVVDGALEEALHLRGVQVDRDYVFDAGDAKQVRQQSRSDGTPM